MCLEESSFLCDFFCEGSMVKSLFVCDSGSSGAINTFVIDSSVLPFFMRRYLSYGDSRLVSASAFLVRNSEISFDLNPCGISIQTW